MSDDEARIARATWSRLTEPGDGVAGAVVAALGPVDALAWLRETVSGNGGVATLGGLGGEVRSAARLEASIGRWAVRLAKAHGAVDLDRLDRLGGTLVVPGDPYWPSRLDDLGPTAPLCLWVRGDPDLAALLDRSVSLIGARACTHYGEHVAADLSAGLARAGWTVCSGGAYGVDAVAHRAALAGEGTTVAFLAGGVDRAYPAGNVRIFNAVVDEGGALVSEVPPGCVPTKSRFLLRNRLIAAATASTVVVEAAWRSGALSTAAHAARLLRPLGAVPGPVTSAASAGCHRLLREGVAVCVTDTAEDLELVGPLGQTVPPRTCRSSEVDGLDEVQRRTLDALPVRRPTEVRSLAEAAGLVVAEVESALGRLELAGLAERVGTGWRRARGVMSGKK